MSRRDDYKPVAPNQTGVARTDSERLANVQDVTPADIDFGPRSGVADEVAEEVSEETSAKDEGSSEEKGSGADDDSSDDSGDGSDDSSDGEDSIAAVLEGNVDDVLAHAEANPDEADDLLAAEEAKGDAKRSTLVEGLKKLLG